MTYRILQGDNRALLKTIESNSIDAIVTDPPYGIDFLGKKWDADTGSLETYQECLRVLKPGGYIAAFSAARTYHYLAITLEQAGFEIKDQLIWLNANGFPKNQHIDRTLERRNQKQGSELDSGKFKGYGTGLKPAQEPICLARKQSKLSVLDTMIKYGVGALNIDAARIQGRHPSNVIGEIEEPYQKYFYAPKVSRSERHLGYDLDQIPTDSGGMLNNKTGSLYNADSKNLQVGNNHPTVKPVDLMRYLIKLITPKGGCVLDPFNGSGSTGIAALLEDFEYIGLELDPAYVEISRRRIEAALKPQSEFRRLFEVAK